MTSGIGSAAIARPLQRRGQLLLQKSLDQPAELTRQAGLQFVEIWFRPAGQIERPDETGAGALPQGCWDQLVLGGAMQKAVIDGNRAVAQPALEAITVAARKQPSAATRSGWSMRLCQEEPNGCGVAAGSAEAGRHRASQRRLQPRAAAAPPIRGARRLQQSGQFLRLVPELPANLRHASRCAFRFERRDQIPQPRSQTGGVEPFVVSQGRKIAEEPMETAQPARLDRRDALACGAPLTRDLVIEKGEARIGQLQQPQVQETGNLDRAVRVLDARQGGRFARQHLPRKMLEACERQARC